MKLQECKQDKKSVSEKTHRAFRVPERSVVIIVPRYGLERRNRQSPVLGLGR